MVTASDRTANMTLIADIASIASFASLEPIDVFSFHNHTINRDEWQEKCESAT